MAAGHRLGVTASPLSSNQPVSRDVFACLQENKSTAAEMPHQHFGWGELSQTGLTHSSLRASLLIGLEGTVTSNRDAGVQSRICWRETCQIWCWARQRVGGGEGRGGGWKKTYGAGDSQIPVPNLGGIFTSRLQERKNESGALIVNS